MIDNKINNANEPEIAKVDLGFVEKRKFAINGDINRLLEICVSDLNVVVRLNEAYPKLQEMVTEAQNALGQLADDAELNELADVLVKIDKDMRAQIDYIFDTNASEICAPSGNMYDPIDGEFRFEHIIECLAKLYETGLADEFKKLRTKTEKYTAKYNNTKKKK